MLDCFLVALTQSSVKKGSHRLLAIDMSIIIWAADKISNHHTAHRHGVDIQLVCNKENSTDMACSQFGK